MNEYSVRNLTIRYSEVEDRLRLDCLIEAEEHSIWLSQRLLKLLVPSISKRLVETGMTSLQSSGFIRDSLSQHKSSISKLQELKQIKSKKKSDIDGGVVESKLSKESHVLTVPKIWLITKAGLKFTDSGIRLSLQSLYFDSIYNLPMTNLEASYFLLSLKDALKSSGWECSWPDWMQNSKDDELHESKFIH